VAAERHLAEGRRHLDEMAVPLQSAYAELFRVNVQEVAGDVDAAVATLRRLVRELDDLGADAVAAACEARLAVLLLERGDEEGRHWAPRLPTSGRFPEGTAWMELAAGRSALAADERSTAAAHARAAVEALERNDEIDVLIFVYHHAAKILAAGDERDEARSLLSRARELADHRGNVVMAARIAATANAISA
jgi:hypothetical protein